MSYLGMLRLFGALVVLAANVANAQVGTATNGPHPSSSSSHAVQDHSVARQWIELLLDSIRNDRARVVVHARNLFHLSAAMWDAWAVWAPGVEETTTTAASATTDTTTTAASNESKELPTPWLFDEAIDQEGIGTDSEREKARRTAISYAAYKILRHRFVKSPGFGVMSPRYDALMEQLGYDYTTRMKSKDYDESSRNDPRAVGLRIAELYIDFGLQDGSREAEGHKNAYYRPVNDPLLPTREGTANIRHPDRWQPLSLQFFFDQAGRLRPYGYPPFLGPEWGNCVPFALRKDQRKVVLDKKGQEWRVYVDPGPPPLLRRNGEVDYRDGSNANVADIDLEGDTLKFLKGFEQVLHWSSHLDSSDQTMIDASPNSIGNATLPTKDDEDFASWFYDASNGGDIGVGYESNPVTGEKYLTHDIPRADYARVLAEFWADGPDSETPPGHWFSLLNDVMDHPLFQRKLKGEGLELDPLQFDVKAYFALGGGMHDAAISAWSVKGFYDYVRPISVIRWMAENGQRSHPMRDSYHKYGLQLIDGLVEIVDDASTEPGERHEHLGKDSVGKIAVKAWKGPEYIDEPDTDAAGVGWILAVNWWPYQRPTFVTPNFAGYVSGHSTFSRAAAEILTLLTGSPYFPGGMGEYVAPAGKFLVFEDGPSVDVRLQWTSYFDASDQCSLSRIWGGIHPPADDIPGRLMGKIIGPQAFDFAMSHFEGTVEPSRRPKHEVQEENNCDLNKDGRVDDQDYNIVHRRYRAGDPEVKHGDLVAVYTAWHRGGGDCRIIPPVNKCDRNGDGRVDEKDYNILYMRYRAGDPEVKHADLAAAYIAWRRGATPSSSKCFAT